MRPASKRWTCMVAGTAMAALLLDAPTASASIFGEENATLGAILAEDIATFAEVVKTVAGIAEQIGQLRTMITQGETVLRSVSDVRSLEDFVRFADQTQMLMQSIDWDVHLLQYRMDTIDRDRKKVFPSLDSVPTGDLPAKAHTWNAALSESSAVAMRAQTSVETLQARMDRMEALLNSTDSAQGVVETLQIIVRALAVLHADLASIEANIAAGERVTATMASLEASEADRSEVVHQRMLDGYTSRGAPAHVLKDLP